MINASKFTSNLRAFSKLDDIARGLFAETSAYVIYQWHAHGNKDPYAKLQSADLPAWVKDGFKKVTMGKRDKSMTDRLADMRGDAHAANIFMGQEQKRAIAKENRAARNESKAQATPKLETTQDVVITSEWALLAKGVPVELTAEEFQVLSNTLAAMRSQKMLKAA